MKAALTLVERESRCYLSVVSAFKDVSVVVQLVGHSRAIDFHTGCENHQLVPLAYLKNTQAKSDKRGPECTVSRR